MSLLDFEILPAVVDDVPLILSYIKKLADYERLAHEVVATEESLRKSLFSSRKTAGGCHRLFPAQTDRVGAFLPQLFDFFGPARTLH